MKKLHFVFIALSLFLTISQSFAGSFRWTNAGGSAWRTESDGQVVQIISPEGLTVEEFTSIEQLEVTWVSNIVETTNTAVNDFASRLIAYGLTGSITITSIVVLNNSSLRATLRGNSSGTVNVGVSATGGNGTHVPTGSTFNGIQVNVLPAGSLPIKLSAFGVEQDKQDLVFSWVTESELNNDFFELEELVGQEFATVPNSYTKGAGTSTETNYYSFTANSVSPGLHYYRLKQQDYDGTVSYSDLVAIDVQSVEATSSAVLEVRGSNLFVEAQNVQDKKVEIFIMNTLGQVATVIPIYGYDAANGFNISTRNLDLETGIYFATLSIESSSLREVKTIKFVSN